MMEHAEYHMVSASAGVDFDRVVHCLMGLPIDAIDMEGAVQRVRQAAFSNTRCFVSTVNVNFLIAARSDAAFRDSLLHSNLVLADGMPLVWMARLLGVPVRERVSGAGLFERLCAHPGPPVSIFVFGGPDGAAHAACNRVNQAASGLRCVGFDAPGFGSVEQMSGADRIERINRSGAQFVVVALGAKKGQAWIEYNRARLNAPVLCHLGAVVNFAAGTLRRAPPWLQALGLEWAWRGVQEPALWRRYSSDGASFLRAIVSEVLPLTARRCLRPPPSRVPAKIELLESPGRVVLELSGDWGNADLDPLRHALSLAQRQSARLEISLSSVFYLESAFIALMMLACGAESMTTSIRDVSPELESTFRRHGAAFLLRQHAV